MTTEFQIYFDGGTCANSNGYGSWEVRWNGFSKKVSRTQFNSQKLGLHISNNVAEYLALTVALEWLKSVKDKHGYRILIHGDSQLVLKTLTGEFKTKAAHLIPLRDVCRYLLKDFSGFKTQWQGRAHNVERFGH